MTREDVIEILENEKPCNKKTLTYTDDVLILALDIAIEALKHDYDNGYRKGFEIALSLNRR